MVNQSEIESIHAHGKPCDIFINKIDDMSRNRVKSFTFIGRVKSFTFISIGIKCFTLYRNFNVTFENIMIEILKVTNYRG